MLDSSGEKKNQKKEILLFRSSSIGPIKTCHSREGGNPETMSLLDSRLRGNDVKLLPSLKSLISIVITILV
jgi:hypothetical protein